MTSLEILKLPATATIEDIKRQYRKLALQFHPDHNPHGAVEFHRITEAYQDLLKNHRPKPSHAKNGINYYRFLGKLIRIPSPNPSAEDINIYCMTDSGKELRITLPAGTKFPIVIDIKNLGNYRMEIRNGQG